MPSATRLDRVAAAGVAGLVCLVYLPSLGNGFVNWDDGIYVRPTGLEEALPSAFTGMHASGNYHPLATLSHAVDWSLWRGWAPGHHLTALLLHGLNAALVVLLSVALIGRRAPEGKPRWMAAAAGAAAGLLWGLHPLRVEAAAWVSERKELLCTLFFLLGVLAYLRYAGTSSRRWYAATLACLGLGLLSKPMAMSFPLVLLVLDLYPLARWRTSQTARILREKIPFLMLAAAAAAVALVTQRSGGAMRALAGVPLSTRVLVAVRATVGYLGQTLWPVGLHPLYGYPARVSLGAWPFLLATAILALLALACIAGIRRQPAPAAALGAYLATLLPVAGIIQVGPQAMADRYTYLPGIALAVLVGAGGYRLLGAAGMRRSVTAALAGGLLLAAGGCAWLTVRQLRVWHDSETLWSRVLLFEPDNPEAHNSRADFYYRRGELARALADYTAALAATPVLAPAHADKRRAAMLNDRAITLVGLGRLDEAVADESLAIRLRPEQADYYANRARMLDRLGSPAAAAADRQRARQLGAPNAMPTSPPLGASDGG